MKIGILCYPTSGGSGVIAAELGMALSERGHEIHLFSYRPPFRLRPVSERFHGSLLVKRSLPYYLTGLHCYKNDRTAAGWPG